MPALSHAKTESGRDRRPQTHALPFADGRNSSPGELDRPYPVVAGFHGAVIPAYPPTVQRKCACGASGGSAGECAGCQEKRTGALQRRSAEGNAPDTVPPIVHELLASPGEPLDAETRAFMEPRFGRDFGAVRVHADAQAAESAAAIEAVAYTAGPHVVFASGQYAPTTGSGRELLAHELTHTVQQAGAHRGPGSPSVIDGDAHAEEQAMRFASAIAQGRDPAALGRSQSASRNRVQRQKEKGQQQGSNAFPWLGYVTAKVWSASLRKTPGGGTLADLSGRPVACKVKVLGRSGGWLLVRVIANGPPVEGYVSEELIEFSEKIYDVDAESGSKAGESGDYFTEEELVQAGLLATGHVLQNVVGPELANLRRIYNEGIKKIELEKINLQKLNTPAEQIAERVSNMRRTLALEVRETGSKLMKQGAELLDLVRGQKERPRFEQILTKYGGDYLKVIEKSTESSKFANALPRTLKWIGGRLWIVSGAISIYVIANAPAEEQAKVAGEELSGFAGGTAGSAIGTGLCIAAGIATEGLGLIVCGLLGGFVGAEAGRAVNLAELLDIGPHQEPALAGKMYRVVGEVGAIDLLIVGIPGKPITEHILVIHTGTVSGELVSGRGHYREYQIEPANKAAIKFLAEWGRKSLPQYMLRPATAEDLLKGDE